MKPGLHKAPDVVCHFATTFITVLRIDVSNYLLNEFSRTISMTYLLTYPPEDDRNRELWLQHVAGFIIFQDMRNYAVERIPIDTTEEIKEQIIKGVDDAIYGLMMMMDGVSGTLSNDEYLVRIESKILLEKNEIVIQEINTLEGDGMCMGFHGWKEGDFGSNAVYTVDE